jgi:hypothetical protein
MKRRGKDKQERVKNRMKKMSYYFRELIKETLKGNKKELFLFVSIGNEIRASEDEQREIALRFESAPNCLLKIMR